MAKHLHTGERLRKVRYSQVPVFGLFYDLDMEIKFMKHDDGAENLMGCVNRRTPIEPGFQVYLVTKKPDVDLSD